jgi:RNA polymerase sigma-70 factor (ECF subfamily)
MSAIMSDFQKIHSDFRPKILRYLTRLVGAQEAEDITQEVFVKISQALQTFRGESQLSTWIYRIATNAALDRIREPSFKRIVPNGLSAASDSGEIHAADRVSMTAEASASIEQQACDDERFECYRDYVQDLPANYRAVVALSELEELTANEIADILGLSLDAVKIRLHRGRARLLKELRTHCNPEDWL